MERRFNNGNRPPFRDFRYGNKFNRFELPRDNRFFGAQPQQFPGNNYEGRNNFYYQRADHNRGGFNGGVALDQVQVIITIQVTL